MNIMNEIIERKHPGSIVKKSLEAWNMSSKEFSIRSCISERTLSDLINCKGPVTFDIATKLATYFGNSVEFWMNLQTQYDLYVNESIYDKEIKEDYSCIKNSIHYLKELSIVDDNDDKCSIVKKTREAICVNRLISLKESNAFVSLKELNSKTINNEFEKNLWLALSLTLARKNYVNEFNKNKLLDSLKEIRSLTTQSPRTFMPRLNEILSECGVSFVLLPYLAKSNIFGATKWLSSSNVMLAMSNRGNRADTFWFTLFHEIAHVTYEHKRYMLLSIEEDEDKEADEFAKNILINPKDWKEFVSKNNYDERSIKTFARKINILPHIVLGRLHNENLVEYGSLDKKLGVFYRENY